MCMCVEIRVQLQMFLGRYHLFGDKVSYFSREFADSAGLASQCA